MPRLQPPNHRGCDLPTSPNDAARHARRHRASTRDRTDRSSIKVGRRRQQPSIFERFGIGGGRGGVKNVRSVLAQPRRPPAKPIYLFQKLLPRRHHGRDERLRSRRQHALALQGFLAATVSPLSAQHRRRIRRLRFVFENASTNSSGEIVNASGPNFPLASFS